jgi:HEAT repeat protein
MPLFIALLILQAKSAVPREPLRALLSRIDNTPKIEELNGVSPRAEEALIELARDHKEHFYVREHAISALAIFRSKTAFKELVRLSADKSPVIRRAAAYAIGHHFGAIMPDDVTTALQPLLKDAHVSVRRQAVRGIAFVPKQQVVGILTQRLALEKDSALSELIYNRVLQLSAAFKQQSPSVR